MKVSGIEWIGEIPEDWEVTPLGQCFSERNEKVSDYDFEPLSVTKQGIVKQLESVAKSNNHDDRKKVCVNDFVINSRSDRKQSCGISPYDGSVSVINIVLNNKALSPLYVKYLLDNYGFAEEFYRWGTGIVADLWSTRYDRMKRIMLPIAPKEKQEQIGSFLDQKVSAIDNILEKTKVSIEEYKKYKQSIITEVVTKGLNPDVEMKDSGIEWIGEIPKHWEVKKMKYLSKLNQKVLSENTDEDYLFRYVDISSVTLEKGIERYELLKYADAPSRARRIVEEGDIIISTVRTYLKAIASVKDDENVVVSTGFAVLTPYDINSLYLEYFCKSTPFINIITAHSTGVSYPAINSSSIMDFKVVIPSTEEQQQIADYLDNKCLEIDNLIAKKEQLLLELESYKKSLIYECVTGKRGLQQLK